ncbi:hypothetical protein [Aquipseudomonas alcaligenes]|uniref:hypothetical protein n=1 Tax=Aquipseudomonas alcaligenes TaxID=43263 RepID=UPI003658081B
MAKRELPLEMGNFVCKFGDANLIDYFEEIVLPAFSDKNLSRKYGQTSYFFEKVKLVTVDGRVLLAGRIIKDMVLEREQVYEEGKGLVAEADELKSSPSSVFVLILDVHRLLYVKETKFAPSLENFKSTVESFLKIKHKKFVDDTYEQRRAEGEKVTKKSILAENFPPSLEIIPLTSAKGIEEFIRQYDVLRSVTYVFSDRNDEQDNEAFFDAVQKQKDSVGSQKTQVVHKNTDGLNKDSVIEEVQAATAQGTQHVKLAGVDDAGNKLLGDNENFQLRQKIAFATKLPSKMAAKLLATFNDLVGEGLVRVNAPGQKVLEKLKAYRDDLDEL